MKVWLYFGDKRVEKRKTPVYKCTLEPVFNETFTFNVPWEKIRECSLDVRVMDFDNIGRNELIGRISLTGEPRLYSLQFFLPTPPSPWPRSNAQVRQRRIDPHPPAGVRSPPIETGRISRHAFGIFLLAESPRATLIASLRNKRTF